MKKELILIVAASLSLLSGCAKKTDTATDSPAFTTEIVSASDSIALNDGSASCSITVSMPVDGPEALVKAVNDWIATTITVNAGDTVCTPTTDVHAVVNAVMTQLKTEIEEIGGQGYEKTWTVEAPYVTDSVVTYTCDTYLYSGGAHGLSFHFGKTFDVASGQSLLSWDNYDLPTLKKAIVKALLAKFNCTSETELSEYLLIDTDEMPLPASAPYILPDGLHAVYQQYEIAPYSTGIIDLTLPL